jgi:hypothetical protein
MRTLELKDIAGYLPYGLKVLYEFTKTATIEAVNVNGGIQLDEKGDYRRYHIINEIERCKPILRPFSDLYRTIIYNGQGIVPIIHFAKRILGDKIHGYNQNYIDLHWIIFEHENLLSKYEVKIERFPELIQNHSCFVSIDHYNRNNKHCYWRNCREYKTDVAFIDYLHELKIDYRGLIDADLAIDVNTLENNPYK